LLLVFGLYLIPAEAPCLDYPTREITLICPFAAGSSADAFTRVAAKYGEKFVGHPIIVDNKVGGGGVRAYAALATAKPDGYTLGFVTQSVTVDPYLVKGVTYNYKRDYRLVCQVDYSAEAIFTKKGGPYDIPLKELVKRAKENPGKITAGVGGSVWSGQAFAKAFFEEAAGIKLNRVPFPGVADVIPTVLGGHVNIALGPAGEWAPLYKGGQCSVLAVSTEKRDPRYPTLPTFKELGYDVVFTSTHWLGVPIATPSPIVQFLAEAFRKGFSEQGFKDAVEQLGGTAAWDGPENSLKAIERVEELYVKVLKKYDVKPQ